MEPGWKLGLPRGPRDVYPPRVERLAQRFQYPAIELSDLIEEQYTLVGQRDFTRMGYACLLYTSRCV